MKKIVICINNIGPNGDKWTSIKKGETYTVVREHMGYYSLKEYVNGEFLTERFIDANLVDSYNHIAKSIERKDVNEGHMYKCIL